MCLFGYLLCFNFNKKFQKEMTKVQTTALQMLSVSRQKLRLPPSKAHTGWLGSEARALLSPDYKGLNLPQKSRCRGTTLPCATALAGTSSQMNTSGTPPEFHLTLMLLSSATVGLFSLTEKLACKN